MGIRVLVLLLVCASVAPAADAFFLRPEESLEFSASPDDWRQTFRALSRLANGRTLESYLCAPWNLDDVFEAFQPEPVVPPPRAPYRALPVFRGYEDARYQAYDGLVKRLVADFNAHKAAWIGGYAHQAEGVDDLPPGLVKSLMVEESGGGGPASCAAWAADPLQVNVPGDWNPYKGELGLVRPSARNEGTPERNIRAGIAYLARKGFGRSGQPAGHRPDGRFDGWEAALVRYNGRRDTTPDGRRYEQAYAERVFIRFRNPSVVPAPAVPPAPPVSTNSILDDVQP